MNFLQSTFALFFIALFFLPASSHAQDGKGGDYKAILKYLKLKEYSVITKTDTIYFLTTLPDKKKKTVIFCQGSGPVPLITKADGGIYPPFPFTIDSTTTSEFNVIMISKPGLKRFATTADINTALLKQGQSFQLDSMNRPPTKYLLNNSLYKLSADCIDVIKFLKKQPWVDAENIYVFGHSQGAVVAAYTAYKDPQDIKGVIYSQSNAYGMYAEYLSTILDNTTGASATDINKQMDSVYQLHTILVNRIQDAKMDSIYQPPALFNKENNDFYDVHTSRWGSFEEPAPITYLLKIDMPILLLNGLGNPGEVDNKNIPLDFIRNHKHNLTWKFYPGYDHNFFKKRLDEKGNPLQPEFHWDDIWADVRNWIDTHQ